jgi:hypothetical protein
MSYTLSVPNDSGRAEFEQDQIQIEDEIHYFRLSEIRPSPKNDSLYKPVDRSDPDFIALAENVRINGVLEPLIVSLDGYIISGHRRHAAACYAGLHDAPCRIAIIGHDDPRFIMLLRDMNRQRVKTFSEAMREEILSADPEESYRLLREFREKKSKIQDVDTITMGARKRRPKISAAKKPLLDAIVKIVNDNDAGALSVRQIFYLLLNVDPPPLIHASKADSGYKNSIECYRAVDDICVRARLDGSIPFDAIHDPTRPVVLWNVFASAAPFIRSQLDEFLKGYYRDLLQSQPNHIEIIGEKNTIAGVIRPVAMDYTIPYTIGRGYSSLPPRHDMATRFELSGKEKLILLVLSDFDPEGEDIGRSFAQSMRDDFDIENIVPIKVALTKEQVEELRLPPNLTAKTTSSRRNKFVEKHGENVFELEAIPPAVLQQNLRDAIDKVIDIRAYNHEVEQEKGDAARLDAARRRSVPALSELLGFD